METYRVPFEAMRLSWPRRLAFLAFSIGCGSIFWLAASVIFDRKPMNPRERIMEALLFACIITVFSAFNQRGRKPLEIVLEDGIIRSQCGGVIREVHLGEIRTLSERKSGFFRYGGVLVSERTRLGAFLWGGVWIPQAIPQYEYLKRVAEMGRRAE